MSLWVSSRWIRENGFRIVPPKDGSSMTSLVSSVLSRGAGVLVVRGIGDDGDGVELDAS